MFPFYNLDYKHNICYILLVPVWVVTTETIRYEKRRINIVNLWRQLQSELQV